MLFYSSNLYLTTILIIISISHEKIYYINTVSVLVENCFLLCIVYYANNIICWKIAMIYGLFQTIYFLVLTISQSVTFSFCWLKIHSFLQRHDLWWKIPQSKPHNWPLGREVQELLLWGVIHKLRGQLRGQEEGGLSQMTIL